MEDRGSTLITVIVAIAFVTILASIILGTTVMNVRMKGIDKIAKDDFYYAEKTLNDVYTGIGLELAKEAGAKYEAAFLKVGTVDLLDPSKDYNLAENAEKEFRSTFLSGANAYLSGLTTDVLNSFVQDPSRGRIESIGDVKYQERSGKETTDVTKASRVVLKDVKVLGVDNTDFQSVITTDIVIVAPTLDFLGTNAEVWDYGLIANEGLYILGDSSVTGNVYAGVHSDERSGDITDPDYDYAFSDDDYKEDTDEYARSGVYGGINIKDGVAVFKGNYIVSKGDINLSTSTPRDSTKHPGLKVYTPASEGDANLANLWCNSLRTIKKADLDQIPIPTTTPTPTATPTPTPTPTGIPTWPYPTIDVNANIFALNDMILNADNSSVVISGNYYGYNDKTVPDVLGKKTGRDDAESSAIIVNGSNAYLDMRAINNFVLMGKAYIDFTSDASTNKTSITSLKQVVPTAESVALKTNQQLYLVPPDFLDGPNPAEDTSDSHTFSINIPQTDLEKWFGYKYLDTSGGLASMHSTYKVPVTSPVTNVYYDYLVFNDTVNWKPKILIDLTNGKPIKDSETGEIQIDKDPDYGTDIYESSSDPLGTGGSVSSKTKFFYDIMNAKKAYEFAFNKGTDSDIPAASAEELDPATSADRKKELKEERKKQFIEIKEAKQVQPSAYRIYERINRSMDYDYFNLERCIVGDTAHMDNAHYYAKNAVINYDRVGSDIQTNVLNNTDGMLRYASYPTSLYNRYRWLCTRLDGNENLLLDQDPGAPPEVGGLSEWVVDTTAPISHFVQIGSIGTMSITDSIDAANADGLNPGPFGSVIATDSSLTIPDDLPAAARTGSTFKGIAIVDGDIIVDSGWNVDGLLMATGTITLKGNNNINYNKGLIQSRIEKEMDIIKNDDVHSTWADAVEDKDYLLITYLIDPNTGSLMYDVEPGTKVKRDRIEADYNDFIFYENWQKGEK